MKFSCICLFFVLFSFIHSSISAQEISNEQDSLVMKHIWHWVSRDSSAQARYFHRMYDSSVFPTQGYVYKQWLVYHFADRCADNVVVLDTITYEVVDMCVGVCEWLMNEENKGEEEKKGIVKNVLEHDPRRFVSRYF